MASPPASLLSASADPEQPTTTCSPLLDKVPAEIRLLIFRCVFQKDIGVVEPVHDALLADTRPRVNTNLFVVSRKVGEEAQDAFFDTFTIIANRTPPTSPLLSRIRHIEFRRSQNLVFWPNSILLACSSKLSSITLARENLSLQSTVREWFDSHKPNYSLECLDLGLFRAVAGDSKLEISVKDFEICDVVAEAKHFGPTLKDLKHSLKLHHGAIGSMMNESGGSWETATPKFLGWSLLACEMHRLYTSGKVAGQDLGDEVHLWYESSLMCGREDIPWAHDDLPQELRIADLNVAEHGSSVVEWATEMMGLNMRLRIEEIFRNSFETIISERGL